MSWLGHWYAAHADEDTRPGLDPDYAAEDAREERAARFEGEVRDFAEAEGWPATLRAVARAMDAQGSLLK